MTTFFSREQPMTKSLPGARGFHPGAKRAPMRWASRIKGTVTTVGVKVIPWIPPAAKRVLLGGRSVIIDGNTLDPTLQLMLSGLHAVSIDGLVADDDPAASRAQMRELSAGFPGPQIHVATDDISIPGPAGEIPARHYRPVASAAAPLLVFYHGGGWVIGDLDTHDALCRLTCRDAGIHVLSVDYRLAPEHPAPAAVEDAYAAFQWHTITPMSWARSPDGSRLEGTAPAATWPLLCANWRVTRPATRPLTRGAPPPSCRACTPRAPTTPRG